MVGKITKIPTLVFLSQTKESAVVSGVIHQVGWSSGTKQQVSSTHVTRIQGLLLILWWANQCCSKVQLLLPKTMRVITLPREFVSKKYCIITALIFASPNCYRLMVSTAVTSSPCGAAACSWTHQASKLTRVSWLTQCLATWSATPPWRQAAASTDTEPGVIITVTRAAAEPLIYTNKTSAAWLWWAARAVCCCGSPAMYYGWT